MHHTAAVLLLLELLAPVITLEDNEILKVISAPHDVKDIVFSLGSNKFPCLFFFFFFLFFFWISDVCLLQILLGQCQVLF